MSNSFATVPRSQAGRVNSQGAPLSSWLPSGLTIAILCVGSEVVVNFVYSEALALSDFGGADAGQPMPTKALRQLTKTGADT